MLSSVLQKSDGIHAPVHGSRYGIGSLPRGWGFKFSLFYTVEILRGRVLTSSAFSFRWFSSVGG